MTNADRQAHWERIYEKKGPNQVSWFQTEPALSLKLIQAAGVKPQAGVIDVGGGASPLVDRLLDLGFSDLSVLDISAKALDHSKQGLGDKAKDVRWIVSDIADFKPDRSYDLWHDRAVFHFLTDEKERLFYVDLAGRFIRPGGHLLLASFAPDGPEKCSGLPVCRYGAQEIRKVFGGEFELLEEASEDHHTPFNTVQKFRYFLFKRN